MKILLPVLLLALTIVSCGSKEPKNKTAFAKQTDTVIVYDTIFISNKHDWQDGWNLSHNPYKDSIAGKPVHYYLGNKKCSPVAADFYFGVFKPTDSQTTAYLLSLVTTKDNSLRPFYRWCLDMTIQVQDGALAELQGVLRENTQRISLKSFLNIWIEILPVKDIKIG